MDERPPWVGPKYVPRDRRLRQLLGRAKIEVQVPGEYAGKVVASREIHVRVNGVVLRGVETTTPQSYLLSVKPPGPHAAVFILANMLEWGRPAAIYFDNYDDARDLSAEWRTATTAALLLRGALRDARGFQADSLDLHEVERLALV